MAKYCYSSLTIFLVLSLLSLSFSHLKDGILREEWVEWNYEKHEASFHKVSTEKEFTVGVDFLDGYEKVDLYIRVEVIPDDTSDAPPLLCFSTSDHQCRKRDQLMKSKDGKTVMLWIRKEEITSESSDLLIMIETEKAETKYTINFKGYENPVFGPNFVYTFLVGKYNKDLDIILTGIKENQYMTIGIDGSSPTVKVSGTYDNTMYEYNHGNVISFVAQNDEGKEEFDKSLTISNMKEGEFVTLNVHTTEIDEEKIGTATDGLLVPNGPRLVGYLNKDLMKEECYPINFKNYNLPSTVEKMFVTGRINSKYSWMYVANEKKNWMEDYDIEIFDGHISFQITFDNTNRTALRYICFELPFEETFNMYEVAYSFSLHSPNTLPNIYNFYEPQIVGEIYRYMLPKNAIAYFHGLETDPSAGKYDFNLYTRKGVAQAYIDTCNTFPHCNYGDETLGTLLKLKTVNQMAIYNAFQAEYKALSSTKPVLVVKCLDEHSDKTGYCEVEFSIFNKGQDVYLVEDEKFSKATLTGEKGTFYTDLKTHRTLSRLTVDIMIFSGDVKFEIKEKSPTGTETHKVYEYRLANKVFYHVKFSKRDMAEYTINYDAFKNSFFTIRYSVSTYNKEQLEEHIPSGESYLVNIDPTTASKSKSIFIDNLRGKNRKPFLANFFELNCEFEVKLVDEKIEFADGYAQRIIKPNEDIYASYSYNFNIKITNVDSANYVDKMCMLYVAGYEMEEDNLREIVIPENVNQQIIFEPDGTFKSVRFLFPHANFTQDLSLFVNVIDKAIYHARVSIFETELINKDITRNEILYMQRDTFVYNCLNQFACPVILELSHVKEIVKTSPMIEITFKQAENVPTYIQKGQAKRDYVSGDNFYYLYTELGKNEVGEVSLNFLREYGTMLAKVVKKSENERAPDWRGRYRMPSETWHDSLPFDEFTKKITITTTETSDCLEGCYLLLTIRINQIGEFVPNYKFYPFSIITKLSPSSSSYIEVPKIVIQVDEFVVGNTKVANDDKIFDFYEVWLPHDSEIVDFDWQSAVAGLYVNLGGIRPTTRNADFKMLPSGSQSILSLSKELIIMTAEEKGIKLPNPDSLEDVNLVIGVWTDKTDSIDSEIYSLRVHQASLQKEEEDEIDIIEVKTDQKILCRPKESGENQYRCLFMIPYDDTDIELMTPLLAFAHSVNPGSLDRMFMNFIDAEIYDKFDKEQLKKAIPNDQVSDKQGDGYIVEKDLNTGKYIFISVVSDLPYDIMLVTSMPVFDHYGIDLYQFYPNPNTEQILAVNYRELNITFPGTDTLSVSIVTLDGNAQIYWQSDPAKIFDLRGEGDRITLLSGKKIDSLSVINPDYDIGLEEVPPYIFYISYHKRKHNVNFDEIKYGKSLEFSYKDTDLPIVLYNKIGSIYNDVSISVTFKDNEVDIKNEQEFPPIYVEVQMVKESTIYTAKKDPTLSPPIEKSVVGVYDQAIKTSQVFLSHEDIESFNVKDEDNPTLYIKISKNYDSGEKIYEKFSIEAQVAGLNDGVIPVEKVYHYQSARNKDFELNIHRLKAKEGKPYMRVHLAFNSDQLNYAISETEERKNITFISAERLNGKIVITFKTDFQKRKIYNLLIFKAPGTGENPELNDYAFKYMNAKDQKDFMDYKIKGSPNLHVDSVQKDEDEHMITCTFDALDIDYDNVNATYYLKIVPAMTYVPGQTYKTISTLFGFAYHSYERNPTPKDGKITLTATSFSIAEWAVVSVVVQVQEKSIIEYVAYEPVIRLPEPDTTKPSSGGDDGEKKSSDDDEDSGSTAFIVVGVILIIIIIALVGLIVYFQMKNKKLLQKVKTVSFQNTNKGGSADPNTLLNK